MTEPTRLPDDFETLAAELALGLLEGEDRAAAQRLRLAEPQFAQAVDDWTARFAPLHAGFAPVEPPASLWGTVESRVHALVGDSNAPAATLASLRRWRLGTFTATAIAAGLALVLVLQPRPERLPAPSSVPVPAAPRQVAIAQLVGEPDGPQVVARYDATNAALTVRAARLADAAQAPELWIIPANGAPQSLGLIAPTGQSDMRVAPSLRALFVEGATLAVTMEQRESAPHEAPSSAPVAAGQISII